MYIRIKKIKNQRYAYLVKNIWKKRKKQPIQKTIKYLGKVYTPTKKEINFEDHYKISSLQEYIEKNEPKKIFQDLIEFELYRHNFKKDNNLWVNGHIFVDLNSKEVYSKNKKIALEINEGFLTQHTIKTLLNFRLPNKITKECGKELANTLLSAGISIKSQFFILLFKKLLKK